jgi:F0F1-type ATP synthase delta subunit
VQRSESRKKELEKLHQKTIQNYEESERLRSEMEDSLVNIKTKVDEYISKAKSELEVDRFQVLNDTKAEAEQILRRAKENVAFAQNQSSEKFHAELLDAMMEINLQILSKSTPDEIHDNLIKQINESVWELGKKEMRQVETIRKSLKDREPTVSVETAKPLTKKQLADLMRTFSALADKNVKLEMKLEIIDNKSLGSGARIRLGDFIVDNSYSSKFDEMKKDAAEELKKRMKELNTK